MAPARRLVAAACTLAALLALAGCGGPAPNEVDMGVASFKQDSVTIKAGQSIHFVDPVNGGGVHVICVGKDLSCIPQPGAPAELSTASGIHFEAGDTRDIAFPTIGTYVVVCTIHPGMIVTIVVQ
jgi:plastocyanin